MDVGRRAEFELGGQVRLAWSRRQQVVTANDLIDVLRVVVDDDREVVRRDAVVADEDEVIDDSGDCAVAFVLNRPLRDVSPEAQGRWPLG